MLWRIPAQVGQIGVRSLLVEGGARVITSLLRQQLVDRLAVCIAPIILGRGIDAIGDLGIADPDEVEQILFGDVSFLGERGRAHKDDDDQKQRDTETLRIFLSATGVVGARILHGFKKNNHRVGRAGLVSR